MSKEEMKIIKLPYYWKDELKEILLSEGFDKVIEEIEKYFRINDLIVDDIKNIASQEMRGGELNE